MSKSLIRSSKTKMRKKIFQKCFLFLIGITVYAQQYRKSTSPISEFNNSIDIVHNYNPNQIQKISSGNSNEYHSKAQIKSNTTIYLGDPTKFYNVENQIKIDDKCYLTLIPYKKQDNSPNKYNAREVFQNDPLKNIKNEFPVPAANQERILKLFNYKLKAKIKGKKSLVINIKQETGDWILVSNDSMFLPYKTRIYQVTNKSTKDVLIHDSDYIGFASQLKAPAGISDGLVMWLNASKPETLVLNDFNEVTKWSDYSGGETSFSKITPKSTPPLYVECDEKMNFHPSIYFRKSKEYLSTEKGPFSTASPNDYTFFSTINADFNNSDRIYFTSYGKLERSDYPALGVRRKGANGGVARIHDNGGAGTKDGSNTLFTAKATTTIAHTLKKNNYFRLYADGYFEQINNNKSGKSSRLNGPGTLGYGGGADDRTMIGLMSEHIAYETSISDTDRDKIDSYLGLKYGITTDKDKNSRAVNFDFKLSDNTSVWNGNDIVHKNYHHNVASVLRDDTSDLYNKQSKSTDPGAIIHMGVGSKLGCNPTLGAIQNDLSSITWGHNNKSMKTISKSEGSGICGDFTDVMEYTSTKGRIWLIDNTRFSQSILVSAQGNDFPFNGAGWEVYMLVANKETDFINMTWDEAIPMSYTNGAHQVNYHFANKFTYISFAAKRLPGACEGCTFTGRKKLDFDNWIKGATSIDYNLGDGLTATVETQIDQPALWRTKYPRKSTLKSLKEYRKGNITKNSTTSVIFNKAVLARFEIFEISKRTGRIDNVEVYGICSNGKVLPKLSYSTSSEKARYTITENKATGKQSSSYTNLRSRLIVNFDTAVEKIVVIHKGTGNTSGSGHMRIGIGAITLSCPKAINPNNDGLAFTKEADTNVFLCNEINFTFKIRNTHCKEKVIDFKDILPSGMKWMDNSLTVDHNNDASINASSAYANTAAISLNNLIVPGSSYITIRAKAYFEETATAGNYNTGKAAISYEKIVESGTTHQTLQSCDRFSGGCKETFVLALESDRPKPIIINSYASDKSCYSPNDSIAVTIIADNKNPATINNMELDFNFNNNFIYVDHTLKINGNDFTVSEIDTTEPGEITIAGFQLPSGTNTITFKIKAPSSTPQENLLIGYNMEVTDDQDCNPIIIDNHDDVLDIPYCASCTKPGNFSSSGVQSGLGISTLSNPGKGNPTLWMQNVQNGHIVIQSTNKGLVITRTESSSIKSPVEGMIIYDTRDKCIKIYKGVVDGWNCLSSKLCNE